jgi:hypothetical protein
MLSLLFLVLACQGLKIVNNAFTEFVVRGSPWLSPLAGSLVLDYAVPYERKLATKSPYITRNVRRKHSSKQLDVQSPLECSPSSVGQLRSSQKQYT